MRVLPASDSTNGRQRRWSTTAAIAVTSAAAPPQHPSGCPRPCTRHTAAPAGSQHAPNDGPLRAEQREHEGERAAGDAAVRGVGRKGAKHPAGGLVGGSDGCQDDDKRRHAQDLAPHCGGECRAGCDRAQVGACRGDGVTATAAVAATPPQACALNRSMTATAPAIPCLRGSRGVARPSPPLAPSSTAPPHLISH